MNNETTKEKGFTLVEVILYVSILTILLSALIPFAWAMIQTGVKNATVQDVYSQARYVSERIKYEVRNSYGINSVSTTQLVLCETIGSCATNPTIIDFSGGFVRIKIGAASTVNLNSNETTVTSFNFTNLTSGATEHVQFIFTITDSSSSVRNEYVESVSMEGSAEVRSN